MENPFDFTLLIIIKIWESRKVVSGTFRGLKMKQKLPTKSMLLGFWEKSFLLSGTL